MCGRAGSTWTPPPSILKSLLRKVNYFELEAKFPGPRDIVEGLTGKIRLKPYTWESSQMNSVGLLSGDGKDSAVIDSVSQQRNLRTINEKRSRNKQPKLIGFPYYVFLFV